MRTNRTQRIRFAVMLGVLAITAIGYFSAGGIGNICAIGWDTITLICPLGAILTMIAQKTAIPLAIISVIAVACICIVLGKVFCSWICPVHFLTQARLRSRDRARLRKQQRIGAGADSVSAGAAATGGSSSQSAESTSAAACAGCTRACHKHTGIAWGSKHAVLAIAIITTLIFGFPVFCLVCPVGLTFAAVLMVMRLFAFGETTWTVILCLAVLVAEVVFLPHWCKSLCPLGALHSILSAPNRTFQPTINPSICIQESKGADCNRCVEACHEGINLHDIALGQATLADCSKCKACSDACPVSAITFPPMPAKDNRQ